MDHSSSMKLHPVTLKYSGDSEALEAPFRRENFRASLTHIRISLIVGILFYSVFGILDALLMPESKSMAWFIRFAVVDPALIGIFLLSFFKVFERGVNALIACASVLAGGGIILMIILAPPHVNYAYYAGIILVLMWTYTFVRIPFFWASWAGWMQVILYEIAAVWIRPTPLAVLINNSFFFISANILGMMASYFLEYYTRRNYYLTQQVEVEKKQIREMNRALEIRTLEYQTVNRELEREMVERKKAEDALRASEKKYRQLYMTAPAAIFEIDYPNRRFISVNEIMSNITGYSKEELMQMDPWNLFTQASQKIYLDRIRTLEEGRDVSASQEYELRKKDGGILWVDMNIDYDMDSGLPVCARIVAHDITERKRSEEALQESQLRLAEAMDLAHIVHWEFDSVIQQFIFNDPFFALLGTTADQEGGYRMTWDQYADRFIHPDDRHSAEDVTRRNLARMETDDPVDVEHRIIRRDGEVRHVLVRSKVVRDASFHGVRIYGTNQDITERKQMDEERHRSERLQGVLETAGAVCHEMNQPMQIVSGYSEMLLKTMSENDPNREIIASIIMQIDRMAVITRKLMAIDGYESQDYAGISRIVDIDKSSVKGNV